MLIYLASPYTHEEEIVRIRRAALATRAVAELIKKGYHVFSPVAYCHQLAVEFELPGDWLFWEEFDRKFLHACDELWVLTLKNWHLSKGVRGEILVMHRADKPIYLIDPDTLEKNTFSYDKYSSL